MIDQFSADPRILQMLPNQPRVLFVEPLTGIRLGTHPAERDEQKRDKDESAHRAIVLAATK